MSEQEIRTLLKQWIVQRSKKGIALDELTDQTPIIESGLLSSLDVAEFVLYIESLRGGEVDIDDIEPDVFNSIDRMWSTFFGATAA
jgi:acyl carrier protein